MADRLAQGQRADIFAPPLGDRAYKLFRRNVKTAPSTIAERAFASETAAFAIAGQSAVLRTHIPNYHGPVRISQVLAQDGTDISDEYWLDLCYGMALLQPDPKECKVGALYGGPAWHRLERTVTSFEEAGIDLGDASVLYWNTDHPIFIDFRLHEGATAG